MLIVIIMVISKYRSSTNRISSKTIQFPTNHYPFFDKLYNNYNMKCGTFLPCRHHKACVEKTKDKTWNNMRKEPTAPVRSEQTLKHRTLKYKMVKIKCIITKFFNMYCHRELSRVANRAWNNLNAMRFIMHSNAQKYYGA